MFAQKGEYDSEARLDCRPASSRADVGALSPDSPLTNGMSAPSADAEPDSSVGGADDGASVLTRLGGVLLDTVRPQQESREVNERSVRTLPRTSVRSVSDFSVTECGVGDLAAIRNVVRSVSGGRTLWLPAVIATAGRPPEGGTSPPSQVSEFVFAGATRRFAANRVTTAASKQSPKVQILSSVTIPRRGPASPVPRRAINNVRGAVHAEYVNQNIMAEMDCTVTPPEFPTVNTLGNGSPTAVRALSLRTSFDPDSDVRHVTRPEVAFHSSASGGSKVNDFLQSDRRFQEKYEPVVDAIRARRVQPASTKITHRTVAEGVAIHSAGKCRGPMRNNDHDRMCAQKQSSPGTKNACETAGLPKAAPHPSSARIILSNSARLNSKIHTQYYRSPESDASVKSVKSRAGTESVNFSTASSNRNLTAQILQSLSRSKVSFPSQGGEFTPEQRMDSDSRRGYDYQRRKRHVHGDPSSALVIDDTVGTEERPAASDDALPYHYRALQTIMLDHTYAVSAAGGTVDSERGTDSVPAPLPAPQSGGVPSVSPARPRHSPPPSEEPRRALERFDDGQPEEDTASIVSSAGEARQERTDGRHDSDTETAPEGEEEGKTRCVCDFAHDDGYMICCDRCGEWQHVDCMGIDRQNIPDDYMCDRCQPRPVDRKRARAIQTRKREELPGFCSSASDSSVGASPLRRRRLALDAASPATPLRRRPLTVTTYSNTVGGVSRAMPGLRLPPALPVVSVPIGKRGPKRPRRSDAGRKGPKRKPPEKRSKRKANDLIANTRVDRPSISTCAGPPGRRGDGYESAATNHYSPELRARVARYCAKVGTPGSGAAAALAARHCTTVPHAGGKILIATRDLRENTPVVELRGKYMLSARHRPRPQPSGRAGGQRPGPFLFFYRLPRDSAQVCIDTRTYGNEARFVRRSCKPNAELQHCIVKGALHVYLATVAPVRSNTEISIRHESAAGSRQACACGNPERCERAPASAPGSRGLSRRDTVRGAFRERRGRARRSPVALLSERPVDFLLDQKVESETDKQQHEDSEKIHCSLPDEVTDLLSPVKEEKEEKVELVVPPSPEKKPPVKLEIIEWPPKDEPTEELKEDIKLSHPLLPISIKEEEETAPEPPLEKASQVILSPQIKLEPEVESIDPSICDKAETSDTAPLEDVPVSPKEDHAETCAPLRRPSLTSCRATRASLCAASRPPADPTSADEKSDCQGESATPPLSAKDKKKMTREERKLEAIMKAIERMEKAEQRKQENRDRQTKRRESVSSSQPTANDSVSPGGTRDEIGVDLGDDFTQLSPVRRRRRRKGRTMSDSRSGTRPDSADSDMVTSGEESLPLPLLSPPPAAIPLLSPPSSSLPPPLISPYREMTMSESQLDLERTVQRIGVGLSSACLLVEAAVAPFDSAFKFPKTKKTIISEWFGETREHHHSHLQEESRAFVDRGTPPGSRSIENLVRVASDMIGSLDGGVDSSPPASPPASPHRGLRRPVRDTFRESVGLSPESKIKTPKKCRRGFKTGADDRPSPHKRSLRSGTAPGRSEEEIVSIETETPVESSGVTPIRDCIVNAFTTVPRPPQHSAKKRWLRQAISEESDSPTAGAESPPSEMVTPLKKRRLARESLSLEPPAQVQSEDPGYMGTPTPDASAGSSFLSNLTLPQLTSVESAIEYNNHATAESSFAPVSSRIITLNPEDAEPLPLVRDRREESFHYVHNDELSKCTVENNVRQYENSSTEVIKPELKTLLCHPEVPREISPSERNGVTLPDAADAPSAETSGGSSPSLDEMDDIQKKIHSFHTENIQILKIRNKKPPKEKRKKVNLNFDLCVLDDQTVGVKLKSEGETTRLLTPPPPSDALVTPDGTPPPPPISPSEMPPENPSDRPLPSPRTPPRPDPPHPRFPSAGLFSSDGFQRDLSETLVDVDAIKNAIDLTTNLETGAADEYVNVREILSRVSRMDSSSSLVLSEVLRDAGHSVAENSGPALSQPRSTPPGKTFHARANDPRLNPPPVAERPKPVRRKLSITEYRKRHNISTGEGGDLCDGGGEDGRGSPVLSPSANTPVNLLTSRPNVDDVKESLLYYNSPDDPPSPRRERERDKLSERLRREFGLTLAEEEESAALTGLPAGVTNGTGEVVRPATSHQRESDDGSPPPSPSPAPSLSPSSEMRPFRLDR